MTPLSCKLLVIGAGPGGYVAVIRAGQLGVETIIVEADAPGGTCLNVGCIPSKAIIHAADKFEKSKHHARDNALGISAGAPTINFEKTVAWKDNIVSRLTKGVEGLLKKNGATLIRGTAKFVDGKNVEVETADGIQKITAENVIIATGSTSVELPFLPFGGPVISSTQALALNTPPEKLVVIGAGYIGLELGIAFAKLGSAVTIVEARDRILPLYDDELTKPVARRLSELGIELCLNAKAKGLGTDQKSLLIENSDGDEISLPASKILVTVGRRPLTQGWGREELVLDMDGPFIKIDERCETSMTGIYAIGDVTGEPMLAHRAMAQGEMVAEIIAGAKRIWDKVAMPAVCFTDPEIVTAGLSPEEARAQNIDIMTASFPFAANGRAMSMEAETGFVRAVARKDNHLILGLQAVGTGVSELSSTFALALEMGACLEDIAGTIHAHPTQGEALQEAVLRTLGHALHI